MDRVAWWVTVHRVAKSQTRMSNYAQHSIHVGLNFMISSVSMDLIVRTFFFFCPSLIYILMLMMYLKIFVLIHIIKLIVMYVSILHGSACLFLD